MSDLPLVFTFKDLLSGNGFYAHIEASGRVMLTREEGGYWMRGVNPGGLAASGAERSEAFREFKKGYLSVLYDIAAEAPSYDAFAAEVESFFNETNEPTCLEWDTARERVRRGELDDDKLEKVSGAKAQVKVDEIRVPTPAANEIDPDYAQAA